MSLGLQLYLDLVAFLFGAVIGSFLNVCIWRMPREESVVSPPSHCPHCGQHIHWYDNLPLVSYLVLRGRCRFCRAPFSARYFLVELLTAVLFVMVWSEFRSWTIPILWLLLAGLLVATFIDFEHYIIPNEITYGGIVLGLLLSPFNGLLPGHGTVLAALGQSLLGGVVGGLVLLAVAMLGEKIFKKEAMGMGDVKFMAAIGTFLGWRATVFILVASSLVGAAVGLIMIAANRKNWQARIPYGPYIALGAVIWVFWGVPIINWYLGFLRG